MSSSILVTKIHAKHSINTNTIHTYQGRGDFYMDKLGMSFQNQQGDNILLEYQYSTVITMGFYADPRVETHAVTYYIGMFPATPSFY